MKIALHGIPLVLRSYNITATLIKKGEIFERTYKNK